MNKRRPTQSSFSRLDLRPVGRAAWALFVFLALSFSACASQEGSDAESANAGMETTESAEEGPGAEEDGADMGQTEGEARQAMSSGIEGRAVIGPTCPAQRVDEPCPERPYPTKLTIVGVSTGDVVTTVECDDEGYFHVELPPGSYRLEPPEVQVVTAPSAKPMTVDVKAGEYTEVVMRFDSGMR